MFYVFLGFQVCILLCFTFADGVNHVLMQHIPELVLELHPDESNLSFACSDRLSHHNVLVMSYCFGCFQEGPHATIGNE